MADKTQEGLDALKSDGDEAPEEGAVEHPLDDAVVDGRMSGMPPDYEREAIEENPSAAEAEEQKKGGA